jgi:parvulin-like peptidyl-prolyl isomerase
MIANDNNHQIIQPDVVVDFLKKNIRFKEIYQQIIYQQIIQQAAQKNNLTINPEEIQAEADKFRLEKRLEKASQTFAWLQDQMITAEDWEIGIQQNLLAKKLAQHLFSQESEKYFVQNKLDFDQVLLYQIVVPFEQLVQELYYQIVEEEISFYEAAHFYDIDERRRYQCGFEGKLYRWHLIPDIATVVFAAKEREIVGPVKTEFGFHLLKVEEFIAAEFTPQVQQEIIQKMFREWLESEVNHLAN